MRKAIKISKPIQAFRLGDWSEMEQRLIAAGTIRVTPNGYELMSLETLNNQQGELAKSGDYFKVNVTSDGRQWAYPNEKSWFEVHHRHLDGDYYMQINQPLYFWQANEPQSEEVIWLLNQGRLVLNEQDEQNYFNAFLWGSPLSAAKDATLVFYEIHRDGAEIVDIMFNFVEKNVFIETYEILTQ